MSLRPTQINTPPQGKPPKSVIAFGQILVCNASHPLRADHPGRCWLIEDGSVDLFAVPVDEHGREGARLPLLRRNKGELIVGLAPPDDAATPNQGRIVLLMVGSLTCRLRQVALGDLLANDIGTPVADVLAWVTALTDAALSKDERAGETVTAALAQITTGDLPKGLGMLGPMVLSGLHDRIRDRDSSATARMQQRTASERSLETAAVLRAAGILSDADMRAGSAALLTKDPASRCFAVVAEALGVTNLRFSTTGREGDQTARLRALASVNGIRLRSVLLREDWHLHDNGPLLAFVGENHLPVALIQDRKGRYQVYDGATGATQALDGVLRTRLTGEAIALYRTTAAVPQSLWALLKTALADTRRELVLIVLMGLCTGLLALATPLLTGYLVKEVIPRAEIGRLAEATIGLLMIAIGAAAFRLVQGLNILRLESRIDHFLQAALFDRLILLPPSFFSAFSVGDLADRALSIQRLRTLLSGNVLQALLLGIFSSVSFVLLFFINWKLALIATLFVVLVSTMIGLMTLMQRRAQAQIMRNQGALDGLTVQLVSAVGKLRIAAAERRAYGRWLTMLMDQKQRERHVQKWANWVETLSAMIPVLALIIIFVAASFILKSMAETAALQSLIATGPADAMAEPNVLTIADFISFNAAFGQFLAGFVGIALALSNLTEVGPLLDRVKPILQTAPDRIGGHADPGDLTGAIELRDLSFSYGAAGPIVLDRLDLQIAAGEFVAIVGASGSGKSTLTRLLIGFETPQSGEVLYDGKALSDLDLGAVRAQIGTVLQNGRINPGTIASNIIGATGATIDDAWRAAELAGLDKDIQRMPMGMHTVLVEGAQTLSGGQRQRLMMARALVQNPKILILDEATSALDNRTQAIVVENMKRMKTTRLVIAHRLSTIMDADRILVMDRGRIVQAGSYAELIDTPGPFQDLASSQLA